MYKVFFNSSIVYIAGKDTGDLPVDYDYLIDIEEDTDLLSSIHSINTSDYPSKYLIVGEKKEAVWKKFRSYFRFIDAAGGIVCDHKNRVLAIKRWGVWDFPKGKLNKNEKPEHAAVREVQEECGISDISIEKFLLCTYHTFYGNTGKHILKRTFWYLMTSPGNETPVPQLEEDITEAVWFSLGKISEIKEETYPSLLDVLDKAGI